MTAVLAVEEGLQEQLTSETVPWGFDCTKRLSAGQQISNETASLVDLSTGVAVALGDSASIDPDNDNVIIQIVEGSVLDGAADGEFPHKFRLIATFDVEEGNTQSTYADILVRF